VGRDDVFSEVDIPVSFQTKIQLSDTNLDEDESGRLLGAHDPLTLVQLTEEFQKNSGIIKLVLIVTESSPTLDLIQALKELLECDDRSWEDMMLRFEFRGDEQEEDWPYELQQAMKELQQVSKERGVTGLSTECAQRIMKAGSIC
jgi:hypothetical protein